MTSVILERLAAVLDLVDECARAWHEVGLSQMSALGDSGLKYKKQSALETTKAVKDEIERLRGVLQWISGLHPDDPRSAEKASQAAFRAITEDQPSGDK